MTDANPKDVAGRAKPDLGLVSGTMMAHLAAALEDGAAKYGVANWRDTPVEARTYVSAALRHIQAWADGEEWVPDSHGHHLGHAMATLAIVLDAQACGTLIDNRPTAGASARVMRELAQRKRERASVDAPPAPANEARRWGVFYANRFGEHRSHDIADTFKTAEAAKSAADRGNENGSGCIRYFSRELP